MKNMFAQTFSVVVVAVVYNAGPALSSDPCAISDETKSASLEMDFQTFDQDMNESPWRKLVQDHGCYRSAAELIAYYIKNKKLLDRHNIRNLRFHSGQLLALAGETESALEDFEKSYWPDQPPSSPLDWNTYVSGTTAFLKRDQRAFDEALEKLTENQDAEGNMDAMNTAVLNRLKACWKSDYHSALIAGEC